MARGMILAETAVRDLARELEAIVGGDNLIVDEDAQKRFLRDFSWYSPLLTTALADTTVDVVVRPGTVAELVRVLAVGVRRRVPVTVRGAGTGNYGQSLPLERGILIDIRRLNRILAVGDETITLEPGVVLEDAERAARERGRELCVMSTTHRVATAAGFVAGGSGGIGSVTYGTLWDGNVPAVDLLTAEDPPHTLHLSGAEVEPVLHTYGTVGVIARVTLRLGPARRWREVYATFPGFDAAAEVAWHVAADGALGKRLVSLQEAPIPTMFEPVKHLFTARQSALLLILEEDSLPPVRQLVRAAGGAFDDWPDKPAIHQFPYSHTILWSKKFDRASTWLQSRYAADRQRFFEQWRAVKARFGDRLLHHFEFARSRDGGGPLPSGIPVVTDPDPGVIDAMMAFFREIGIRVHNPHSYVVQEGGFVGGAESAIALKQRTDPFGLLNPGKLERSFYEPRMGRGAAS
jgi:FAD/FMN-containing dehydrogenase